MSLSDFSIRRPVAMLCLIIGLTVLGFNAYRKMGLELMPRMDIPFITVVTVYPGASPEEIETDIAKRIEDQVVTIDGLKHVSSVCMENACQTLLEFNLGVNVDIAATDVREKLDLIRADFPQDVEDPRIVKFDINAKAIATLALTGDAMLEELFDYADNTLRDRITVIPGVADAQLLGGAEREVQVQLDREKLAARGLSATDVVQAIQQEIRTIPSGRVREDGTEYAVKFDADYDAVAEIGNLEVRPTVSASPASSAAGQRCYIRDLGQTVMTTEELRQKAAINGRPCIAIKVVKKADANAVRVVDAVRAAMTTLEQELPGGMELIWVTDDGAFTKATVSSAWSDVTQGIVLTGLILFLFLYNFRSTLVVAITMPLTIVISLFFMQFMGYTLNTSTLLSAGLSVGILVTNSIVVLEAIDKRLSETGDVKESARLGAQESWIPVLASAGTNAVVLLPICVMPGLIGLFMQPFATTMLIMTLVSLFISFTLTPLLCSVMLKPKQTDSKSLLSWVERGWNRMFDWVVDVYRSILRFNEAHRVVATLVLLAIVAMFIHSLALAAKVGFAFVSIPDRGEIFVKLEYPTRYDLAETEGKVRDVENLLKDVPDVRSILSTIGKVEGIIGQSTEGVYLAQILLRFSDRNERSITLDQIKEDVRSRLTGLTDCTVTVSTPSIVGGQESAVQLEISGDEIPVLEELALKAQLFSEEIGGFIDPDTTVRIGKPELRVRPDRAVLADLGVPATGLGLLLRANLEGLEAGTFKQGARNYDIVVKLAEEPGKRQVQEFLFPGPPGHPLLLTNLGKVQQGVAPIQIAREDKRRASKMFSDLRPDKPVGTAVRELSDKLDARGNVPAGYSYRFAGDYEYMTEAQVALGEAAVIAILLVFLTLAAILESFKQPIVILVTLPLGVIGIMWSLAATGESLGLFVILGAVMLIGIVVNNAILIIDQFNVLTQEGVPRHEAMIQASCDRFRPIVMITLAAVLGMLPLAFGRGIGAELRNGLGIASAGGILISGILTVVVLPILYDLTTRAQKREKTKSNE